MLWWRCCHKDGLRAEVTSSFFVELSPEDNYKERLPPLNAALTKLQWPVCQSYSQQEQH